MAPTIGYLLDTNVLVALIRGKELGKRIDAQYNLRAELNRLQAYPMKVRSPHRLESSAGFFASERNPQNREEHGVPEQNERTWERGRDWTW